MNKNDMIAQLRKLRKRREEHAREVVAVHKAGVSEARQDVDTKSKALADHTRQAVEEQNAVVSGLVDRVVRASEFHLAQSRYEASSAKAGQIKAQNEAALLVQKQREAGLAAAQQQHLQSRKALMKVERLTDRLEKRMAPRRAAAAELLDEEGRSHATFPHKQ
ncbi:hypothetical protein [Mesorhizobium sp. 1M-11]|uniref:hypothetical protein n=1 Tax=Mesorhizobium sp. 1M-11 TaxID=1529006 RepID=UPI00128F8013|nr:hypothetical protein [Mesorhizobium sp. 1M-11]